MAHTKFTLSVDEVLSDERQLEIIAALEPIVQQFGLQRALDVLKPKLTVKIETDQSPSNPRTEQDNVGVMFCKHRNYTLGDEGADDPIVEEDGKEIDGIWLTEDEVGQIEAMLEEAAEAYGVDVIEEADLGQWGLWTAESIHEVLDSIMRTEWDTRHRLRDDIAICLPLYLYDHSGITISHGAFSCQWDSGQVGWHYMTKEALDAEWGGDEANARKCLEAELQTYDHYLTGNVWAFDVEDEDGDIVDSCSGFYGTELEDTGILDYLDTELHELAHEAWENRFD